MQYSTTTLPNVTFVAERIKKSLPDRPYCGSSPILSRNSKICDVDGALSHQYIQLDHPKHQRYIVLHVANWSQSLTEKSLLPDPTWVTVGRDGTAELVWGLKSPVFMGAKAKSAPKEFLARIARGFADALGASISSSSTLSRNPLHASWRTYWCDAKFYGLSNLNSFLGNSKLCADRRHNFFARIGSIGGQKSGQVRKERIRDIRCLALQLFSSGECCRSIAEKLAIGKSTVARWILSSAPLGDRGTFFSPKRSTQRFVGQNAPPDIVVEHPSINENEKKKNGSRYDQNFKKLAVRNVLELGLSMVEVAQEMKVSKSTISLWIKQAKSFDLSHEAVISIRKELPIARSASRTNTATPFQGRPIKPQKLSPPRIANELLEQLREIKIEFVMTSMGLYGKRDLSFTPKKAGTSLWHVQLDNGMIDEIVATDQKWFSRTRNVGGYGAIDMTMNLFSVGFTNAIRILREFSDSGNSENKAIA